MFYTSASNYTNPQTALIRSLLYQQQDDQYISAASNYAYNWLEKFATDDNDPNELFGRIGIEKTLEAAAGLEYTLHFQSAYQDVNIPTQMRDILTETPKAIFEESFRHGMSMAEDRNYKTSEKSKKTEKKLIQSMQQFDKMMTSALELAGTRHRMHAPQTDNILSAFSEFAQGQGMSFYELQKNSLTI